jgi:hypothetical protein
VTDFAFLSHNLTISIFFRYSVVSILAKDTFRSPKRPDENPKRQIANSADGGLIQSNQINEQHAPGGKNLHS